MFHCLLIEHIYIYIYIQFSRAPAALPAVARPWAQQMTEESPFILSKEFAILVTALMVAFLILILITAVYQRKHMKEVGRLMELSVAAEKARLQRYSLAYGADSGGGQHQQYRKEIRHGVDVKRAATKARKQGYSPAHDVDSDCSDGGGGGSESNAAGISRDQETPSAQGTQDAQEPTSEEQE